MRDWTTKRFKGEIPFYDALKYLAAVWQGLRDTNEKREEAAEIRRKSEANKKEESNESE